MSIALGLLMIFASAWVFVGVLGLIEQFTKGKK